MKESCNTSTTLQSIHVLPVFYRLMDIFIWSHSISAFNALSTMKDAISHLTWVFVNCIRVFSSFSKNTFFFGADPLSDVSVLRSRELKIQRVAKLGNQMRDQFYLSLTPQLEQTSSGQIGGVQDLCGLQ